MISAGEFRNGVTFEQDGQVLQVVEFQHVKPGKGAAFVRTKTKNVITGSVVETSYNPTAKFPQAFIERREVTYSYEDGDLYYFMDNETYEQIPVAAADVPENFKFCKENEICKLLSYKGKVFSVEIPNFIELEVTETEPGFKGNTATTPRSTCAGLSLPMRRAAMAVHTLMVEPTDRSIPPLMMTRVCPRLTHASGTHCTSTLVTL